MDLSTLRSAVDKSLLLASLLPTRPQEFYDRLLTIWEVRTESLSLRPPTYQPVPWDRAVRSLERALRGEAASYLGARGLREIEQEVSTRISSLGSEAPFRLIHNADLALARFCYLACRLGKPKIVLETGVAYGVTSAFILKALEENGAGFLHSIDLPPLGHQADGFVGKVIPERLQQRWRLHRGSSKRILPGLLRQLEKIDCFVHDSLHTYKNIRAECRAVYPYLSRPAVVVADDIGDNSAFLDWIRECEPRSWATVAEEAKDSMFGMGVF